MRSLRLGLALSSLLVGCLDRPTVGIEPNSFQVHIQRLDALKVEKVDLLFVVDGSGSMADKQTELGKRIPELISSLTTPTIDPITKRESRVYDVHVGVISTNMGTLNEPFCVPSSVTKYVDDKAWLLPRPGEATGKGYALGPAGEPVPADCPEPRAHEPMTWVTDSLRDKDARFVGDEGAKQLQAAASCAVASVSSAGCGVEQTWEALYRFLLDPAPPKALGSKDVDQDLLAQRKKFLRPDSLLAVVVLTDENDFSFRPSSQGMKLLSTTTRRTMAHGSAGCANVPDDIEATDPAGVQTLLDKWKCAPCAAGDPACPGWVDDVDHENMRGFHQIQRFGFDALFPRRRYIDGLTKGTRSNPVFADGRRTQDLVIVAGIVGVPEVLVAKADHAPKDLSADDWKKLISPNLSERDPHMIESIVPRPGLPKYAGNPSVDPISGGERDTAGSDLQYACIAPRSSHDGGEDCDETWATNPLCKAQNDQPFFKAYPAIRHLRILHDLGGSGFVASICAESYRPAMKGITDRIRRVVDHQCVRSELTADDTGNVKCLALEALPSDTFEGKTRCEDIGKGWCTPGSELCRGGSSVLAPVTPEDAAAQLEGGLKVPVIGADGLSHESKAKVVPENGNVYAIAEDGKKRLVCELLQLSGGRVPDAEAAKCRANDDPAWKPSIGGGWCYAKSTDCGAEATGSMRFVGDAEPKSGSAIYTMCVQ